MGHVHQFSIAMLKYQRVNHVFVVKCSLLLQEGAPKCLLESLFSS